MPAVRLSWRLAGADERLKTEVLNTGVRAGRGGVLCPPSVGPHSFSRLAAEAIVAVVRREGVLGDAGLPG